MNESKFGKRKYNKGHRVGEAWVVGVVVLTWERKIFLMMIVDSKAQHHTLLLLLMLKDS